MTGEHNPSSTDPMLASMLQFGSLKKDFDARQRQELDRAVVEKAEREQAIRNRAQAMGQAVAARQIEVQQQPPTREPENQAREQEAPVREVQDPAPQTTQGRGQGIFYGSREYYQIAMEQKVRAGIDREQADVIRLGLIGQGKHPSEAVRERDDTPKSQGQAREVEARGIERLRNT